MFNDYFNLTKTKQWALSNTYKIRPFTRKKAKSKSFIQQFLQMKNSLNKKQNSAVIFIFILFAAFIPSCKSVFSPGIAASEFKLVSAEYDKTIRKNFDNLDTSIFNKRYKMDAKFSKAKDTLYIQVDSSKTKCYTKTHIFIITIADTTKSYSSNYKYYKNVYRYKYNRKIIDINKFDTAGVLTYKARNSLGRIICSYMLFPSPPFY